MTKGAPEFTKIGRCQTYKQVTKEKKNGITLERTCQGKPLPLYRGTSRFVPIGGGRVTVEDKGGTNRSLLPSRRGG